MTDDIDPDGGTVLRDRLRQAVKATGSVAAFAEKAGVSENSLNKWLRGTQPSPSALVRLADAAEVTIDYLVGRSWNQKGPEHRSDQDLITNALGWRAENLARALGSTTLPDGFVYVPRLDIHASAGGGRVALPDERHRETLIAFREDWLRSLGVLPQDAEFIVASGDSMEDTILDGDLLLVDRGTRDLAIEGIYALVLNDQMRVKRLHQISTGAIRIISDNPRYPEEVVGRADIESFRIEGRIRWYGRPL